MLSTRAGPCIVGALALTCARAFILPTFPWTALGTRSATSPPSLDVRTSARSCTSLHTQAKPGFLNDPLLKPLEDDDYVAIGLACCYVMNDNLKLDEYYVFEPLTAGTLETIAGSGLETSYRRVAAFKAKDIFEGTPAEPTGIKVDQLQILVKDEVAHICEDALERTLAAARTFKRRVEAQMVGFGDVTDELNFSTERKRILNHKYEPSFDDNVKQDKSIDVYGRDDEEATMKQVADLENI